MPNKRAVLCILDGWGIAPPGDGNAITLANPETFNHLNSNFPSTHIDASGPAVGLPEYQDGNSETGHLNIGAGRVVYQDLALINMSISDGSFFTNKALLDTAKHITSFKSRLHLLGMIGNSGVHSYNEHLFALILFAKRHHINEVYLHLITDGRDSPPDNSPLQIQKVIDFTTKYQVGSITSVMGRYYAMDRDMRLDRTQIAFDCLTKDSDHHSPDPLIYIENSYKQKISDEFIFPTQIGDSPENTRIKAGDAVVFFNFRTDRARQLTDLFLKSGIPNLRFVSMTRYRKDFTNPVLFPTSFIDNTLGEVISTNHLTQLRAAETEKIAMVSYYFNGQSEEQFEGETRLFVDSPKISTYDLQPAMSTPELVSKFSQEFKTKDYSLGVINFACPDMVAHTGKIDKTIEAVKAADRGLSQLVNLCKETNAYLLITADHGNAEELLDVISKTINTEHSANPVPLIIYHPTDNKFKLNPGRLGDVAPTILELLDIQEPDDMSGTSLILRDQNLK